VTTVRGVDIAVTDSGTGPAVLWGHGFASCVAHEANVMVNWTGLTDRYRVVQWDARGHGRSAGTHDPADYHWDNLGRDLLALADALGIDSFVAGGVSMGAATALHAVVDAPDRVKGLVLALPPTAYDTRPAQGNEYLAGADLVEQRGVDAYVERLKTQPVPEILTPIAEVYHSAPAIADDLLPAALRGAGTSDLPSPDRLRAIAAPALVLAWTTDPGHPLSTAERLVELLPDAEIDVAQELFDVLSWTGHVEAFLDRVS
jgi:pimeloyl-ACP methyl ester carboxylesterase